MNSFNTINIDSYILILVYRRDFILVGVYIDKLLLGSKNYTTLE